MRARVRVRVFCRVQGFVWGLGFLLGLGSVCAGFAFFLHVKVQGGV